MSLSAKEAANAVGIGKHGIIKAIREGRISGVKNKKGEWTVETSELFRVYDPVNQDNSKQNDKTSMPNTPNSSLLIAELKAESKGLKEKITVQEKIIEGLEADKAFLQAQLKSTTLLLEDMRFKSPQKPTQGFKWFFGRDGAKKD